VETPRKSIKGRRPGRQAASETHTACRP
jgi:hypothetical protein